MPAVSSVDPGSGHPLSSRSGRIEKLVPAVTWLRSYQRDDLPADAFAGVIVAVMLIPQGMAYAALAGLPLVVGLYASTIPLLVYALLGSSRHLAVGPVAIVSLVTLAGISRMAEPGSSEFVGLALLLMLMTGVLQLVLGLIRAGFITRFFSHAVVSGFTSAAAIVIALSQFDNLVGIDIESSDTASETIEQIAGSIGEIHFPTAIIGLASVALLLGYSRFVPRLPSHLLLIASRFPAPLILVLTGSLAVWGLGLDERGVEIVGDIPRGLPSPSLPDFDRSAIVSLIPTMLTISFLGYVESISVARTIAAREKERVDANQELYALGLSNIAGSFFSGYPVTGSFSRTAVNYQTGARTQMSGVVAALIIILTLLVLTPLFFYLPRAVLAAVIIVAVSGLVNIREARHFLDVRSLDGLTVVVTFVATLAIGVEWGILIGFLFSIGVFIWRSTDPHIVEVGYVEMQRGFRSRERYPDSIGYPNTLILRIAAPLYFANMEELESQIEQAVAQHEKLKWIILDCTGVADIDAVALDALEDLTRSYQAAGITVQLACVRGHLLEIFERAAWFEQNSSTSQYPTVELALESLGLIGPMHVDSQAEPVESSALEDVAAGIADASSATERKSRDR